MAIQMGMPDGFAALIQRKYDIMQQQADSQRTAVTAGANLDNVKAKLMPGESAANVAESAARTTNLGLTGRTILPLAGAQIGLLGAQTRNTDAGTVGIGLDNVGKAQLVRPRARSAFGLGTLGDDLGTSLRLGF